MHTTAGVANSHDIPARLPGLLYASSAILRPQSCHELCQPQLCGGKHAKPRAAACCADKQGGASHRRPSQLKHCQHVNSTTTGPRCTTPATPLHTPLSLDADASLAVLSLRVAGNQQPSAALPLPHTYSKGMIEPVPQHTPDFDTPSIRSCPAVRCAAGAAPMLQHPHRAGTRQPPQTMAAGHPCPRQQQIFHRHRGQSAPHTARKGAPGHNTQQEAPPPHSQKRRSG
jgi:hypothetical protein